MSNPTGTTTRQMEKAPQGAIFVWCTSDILYPRRLAASLCRDDLVIKPRSWLRPDKVHGCRTQVVVDHNLYPTDETRAALNYLHIRGLTP